jgi:hypothetical protein
VTILAKKNINVLMYNLWNLGAYKSSACDLLIVTHVVLLEGVANFLTSLFLHN